MEDKNDLLQLLEQKRHIRTYNSRDEIFPETGQYSRDKYSRHLAFFESGAHYKQRAMICANQVGKSLACAYEVMLHLTGDYPDWWTGLTFDHPVQVWAAGFKANVKESIQQYLVGSPNDPGTGMIPKEKIQGGRLTRKAGVVDTFQDLYIPYKTGGFSRCTLKTYDEKVKAFQGAILDLVWLDEEPDDASLYGECLTRLIAKEGSIMCSFTPLKGLSDTVLSFLDNGKMPDGGMGDVNGKYVVNITWDDVPHLSEDFKKELKAGYLPHQLEARTKGIPALGAGAIYPIKEEEVAIPDFRIPAHWPKSYGLDVGWNRTAAIFGAYDVESDTWYIYSEYYRAQAEPSIHADAIKARGEWICGVIDPASQGVSQSDGKRLATIYANFGLNLGLADNSVEAGLLEVWQRLSSGRLKVFKSCGNWINEFRIYRRDENGRIVKKDDHLMDATRYLMMSGQSALTFDPSMDDEDEYQNDYVADQDRSSVTGY